MGSMARDRSKLPHVSISPAPDGETVADPERDGGLEGVGREVDLLDEVRSRPVVAPVHRGAVRGVETQAHGPALGGFVVDVHVQRGGHFVVRILRERALVAVFHRGERRGRHVGKDTRRTDGDVEFRLLECRGRRVEVDRLRTEFHRRADVGHAGLTGREVVYLVTFGECARGGCDGGEQEKCFFHNLLV